MLKLTTVQIKGVYSLPITHVFMSILLILDIKYSVVVQISIVIK